MALTDLEREFAELDKGPSTRDDWEDAMSSFLLRAHRAGREDLMRAALVTLAQNDQRAGNYQKALVRRQQLLAQRPEDAMTSLVIAQLLHRLGRRADALAMWERVAGNEDVSDDLRRVARDAMQRRHSQPSSPTRIAAWSPLEFHKGDVGLLNLILARAKRIATKRPAAAEALAKSLRQRALAVGDEHAVETCDWYLAMYVAQGARQRIARCRRLLRTEWSRGPHLDRRRAYLLARLAIDEQAVGWTAAANMHREEALTLVSDDPACDDLRRSLTPDNDGAYRSLP